jgi:hypothetical protein
VQTIVTEYICMSRQKAVKNHIPDCYTRHQTILCLGCEFYVQCSRETSQSPPSITRKDINQSNSPESSPVLVRVRHQLVWLEMLVLLDRIEEAYRYSFSS